MVMRMLRQLLEMTLRKDLENYNTYFDNFFISPDLILHLKKIGLSATGTVRQNRVKINVDLPKNVIEARLHLFTIRVQKSIM